MAKVSVGFALVLDGSDEDGGLGCVACSDSQVVAWGPLQV